MKNERRIKDLLPERSIESFFSCCEELSDIENNDMYPADYHMWLIGWTDCIIALSKWLDSEVDEEMRIDRNKGTPDWGDV